ncbi:MAG: adenosine kinase [Alphaproteobacteria bacterium]|jgi:sugar/nucleoside kinase (ribokinase family)
MNIVCIGNAIVDILAEVDDNFLLNKNISKGSMNMVSKNQSDELIDLININKKTCGGSASNTATGLSLLGCEVSFIGKTGNDDLGQNFKKDLNNYNITGEHITIDNNLVTGRSIVLITPDKERTMNTYLGASSTLSDKNISMSMFKNTKGVFIEGYLWYLESGKKIINKSVKESKKNGGYVALSLSDNICVDLYRKEIKKLIKEKSIDYLFGNKNEVSALLETNNTNLMLNEALELSNYIGKIIITDGSNGSYLIENISIEHIKPVLHTQIIDTTGAGDLYASGFLKGIDMNLSGKECAYLGNLCGSEIIKVIGAKPDKNLFNLIKNIN